MVSVSLLGGDGTGSATVNIYCHDRIVGMVVLLLVYYSGCVDGPGSLSGSAFNQLKLVTLIIVITILY